MMPFAPDAQIQIDQILSESLAKILQGVNPRTAEMLEVLRGKRATVVASSSDLFEARLNESPIRLGQTSYRNVKVRLIRTEAGRFDFEVAAEAGNPPRSISLFSETDLQATRSDGAIVLSKTTEGRAVPVLRAIPRRDQVDLEVFTQSFIEELPGWARSMVPERIQALRISALPPASEGDAAVQRASEQLTRRAADQTRTHHQRLAVGIGLQIDPWQFVAQGSWQYTWEPVEKWGSFFQVPLQVSIQYAPPAAGLGRVAGGVGTSFGATKVPVNIRLLLGGGGGRVFDPETQEFVRAAGLTLGGEVGVEIRRWRVYISGEHLWNLWPETPIGGVTSVVGGAGYVF